MTLDFFEGWRIFVSGRGTNIYLSYFCNEGEIIPNVWAVAKIAIPKDEAESVPIGLVNFLKTARSISTLDQLENLNGFTPQLLLQRDI